MQRKKTISPEKPVQDSIEYRFKQLLLPNISYALAVTILGGFISGIFAAINTKSITEAIVTLIGIPAYLLIVGTLGVWFIVRESDIVINSENISAVDYWYHRKCIGWQEMTLIKQSHLLGIRYLSIKAADGRSVQIASHYYNSSELLDRVCELAGEEHILVRALEKELSRPRYELTKLWCWVIGSIALTMSIYLIGGNMYAAEQEKPLEQAIAIYVRQHPKTAPNQSAIDLQSLMTKLGLYVEVFGDGSKAKVKPSPTAIAEWKTTRSNLEKYLDKQLAKTEDSIDPLPTELSNYLRNHQANIVAIETHLIDNPLPQWGVDLDWIQQSNLNIGNNSSSPLLRYLDLFNTEKLLIVNILGKQQLPNTDLSKDLAAIEKIQQSIQSQPSFIGQLVSRIGEGKISKLVRQVDTIPNGWGTNLFRIDRHQQMLDTISGESMMTGRIMQDSSLFNLLLISQENPLRFIPGFYHLARPQLRLATVNRYAETQQGLAYWRKQNICHTDGKNGVMDSPPVFGLVDDLLYSPTQMTSQYKKVLKQDLYWELTNSVRQVKAKLAAGEKVDRVAKEFKLPSQVCPGENWTAQAKDGAVSIEFSHPPDWKALGVNSTNIDPLTYKIKPVDR